MFLTNQNAEIVTCHLTFVKVNLVIFVATVFVIIANRVDVVITVTVVVTCHLTLANMGQIKKAYKVQNNKEIAH